MQSLLHAVIQAKPVDPYAYMMEQLSAAQSILPCLFALINFTERCRGGPHEDSRVPRRWFTILRQVFFEYRRVKMMLSGPSILFDL